MSFAALIKALDKFLFYPRSPAPIALFRIVLGVILLVGIFVQLLPDFKLYFGDHAIIPIESTMVYTWGRDNYFDLLLVLPPGEQWKLAILWILIMAAFCLTIGLFTGVSTIIALLCLLSFDSHFPMHQDYGDILLRLSLMMLAMSSAKDAFSLDNIIKSFRQDWRISGFAPRLSAPWAQRMLQMQVAFINMNCFVAQLPDTNWFSGLALYNVSRYDDMIRFRLPSLFDNLACIKALTWCTMAIEFCMFTLVWFREFKYWIILSAVILNLLIQLSMNSWLFIATTLALYILFIEPEDLHKVMDWIRTKVHRFFGQPSELLFDGNCLYCVRIVGILHRLDIFAFLNLLDAREQDSSSLQEINTVVLKTRSGSISGFQALRWLALRLPLLLPLVPILYLPGLSLLGTYFYKMLSGNRKLLIGATCKNQ
jgi:predicted DCC family thiol-disulfide oxidoreductase YuxK